MSDLHIVIGAGPLGRSVAAALLESGQEVRVVTRRGDAALPGAASVAADVTDPAAAARALRGARVVYQCAQPDYHRWPQEFPALQAAVLDAAVGAGADLVIGDNLYGYGVPDGPITEDTPIAPSTRKGRVRVAMAEAARAAHDSGRLRIAFVRPADYFGPGYQPGAQPFRAALGGKRMQFLGRADQPHSFCFIPDAGRAMALLGTTGRGWGSAWIPPTQPAIPQRELAARIWAAAGRAGEPRLQLAGATVLRLVGVFAPSAREVVEMLPEFERPYVVDSSRFEREFGTTATPLDDAIEATLASLRPERVAA